jgi:imidazolonepropionase-like amidohydrolase
MLDRSPPGRADVWLRAARILDVENGRQMEETYLHATGERVVSVDVAAPAGAEVVDLGDRTILPGLIDAHTHVLLHSNRMTDITAQDNITYQILQEYPSHRVARGVRALRIALEHGFTTLRDLGTEGAGYDDVGLRDAVSEGIIPGPRMQVAGRALSPTGTYPILRYRPDWAFPSGVGVCDGADNCRREVREQASRGTDWLKVYATMGYGSRHTDDGYIDAGPNWTRDELDAIVDEAHARGLRVAAHATTITGTQMAIDASVDSIEHAHTIRPEMARQMVDRDIFAVFTLTTSIHTAAGRAGPIPPLWGAIPEVQIRSLGNCVKEGVKIAFGTDVGSGSIPWTHVNQAREFSHLVAAGLTTAAAIKAATAGAAELLALPDGMGSIRAGAPATLIAVPGDPLTDISVLEAVDFVMHDGAVISAPNEAPA